MKRSKVFLAAIVLFALGIVLLIGDKTDSQITETPEQNYGTIELTENKPDWTLSIPSIEFEQQMSQITKRGTELPVPDDHPGYYLTDESNIFIVGHNLTVFNRLSEIPEYIEIYRNSMAIRYDLDSYQTLPLEEINMDDLLSYKGVVLMTCAGESEGNTYSHRLILYYH